MTGPLGAILFSTSLIRPLLLQVGPTDRRQSNNYSINATLKGKQEPVEPKTAASDFVSVLEFLMKCKPMRL
jgi:hypothetical protein